MKEHRIMCDRVFYLKPTDEHVSNLSEKDRIIFNNIDYNVNSMTPIVTTMTPNELEAFPSKISNIVLLRTKGITPAKPPRVLVFHHPCRTELKSQLQNVASYFDLRFLSLETTLVNQREKLKSLGSHCHEILTKVEEVPDDVKMIHSDLYCFHAVRAQLDSLHEQRLAAVQLPKEQEPAISVSQAKTRSLHCRVL